MVVASSAAAVGPDRSQALFDTLCAALPFVAYDVLRLIESYHLEWQLLTLGSMRYRVVACLWELRGSTWRCRDTQLPVLASPNHVVVCGARSQFLAAWTPYSLELWQSSPGALQFRLHSDVALDGVHVHTACAADRNQLIVVFHVTCAVTCTRVFSLLSTVEWVCSRRQ